MTPQQLKLYELLGSRELTPWCLVSWIVYNWEHRERKLLLKTYNWYVLESKSKNFNEHCDYVGKPWSMKIIGHPPTIADLHRWLTDNGYLWTQWLKILVANDKSWTDYRIYYNSSLPLLDQTTETLDALIELIDNHK